MVLFEKFYQNDVIIAEEKIFAFILFHATMNRGSDKIMKTIKMLL